LNKAKQAEEAKRVVLPSIRALYDLDANAPPTKILRRGDPLNPGDEVEPGVFAVLDNSSRPFRVAPPTAEAKTTGRRRALAEWLTRPDHPLTARVIVNRIWHYHFGAGIVPTLDNFGTSGAKPTHPKLLDWLAVNFMVDGQWRLQPLTINHQPSNAWSMKKMHRLIMTSTVYRQSSHATRNTQHAWRPRPRRLEAEIVRDAILATAGTLDLKMFGEPVPTEAKPSGEIVPVGDAHGGRRSIYQLVRRSRLQSLLIAFDAPVMETNCARRSASTTATQSLALMNSEFISAHAERFAKRVLKEQPPFDNIRLADPKTITYAFRLAFARQPTMQELSTLQAFIKNQTALYAKTNPADATLRAYADLCQALLSANEFVYVD
jgi:hypothetical protein